MNFTIDRLVLLENLNNVSYGISTKMQMPGLTGIKFEVRKEFLILTTNNNEFSIKAVIKDKYNCISEGDFLLSGKIVIEIVKKLIHKDVNFMSFEDNTIKILSGKSDFTITCMDFDTFLDAHFAKTNLYITLDALNLKQSTSDSKPIISGLCIRTKGNVLEFVGCDIFRIARKQIVFKNDFPNFSVVIPGKNLEALSKIIGDSEEENVEIYCSSNYVLFKYANISFNTRLIDGTVPDIDRLVTTEYLIKIKFNKDELISVVDRVSLFVSNEMNTVKFTMNADGFVEFSAETNQLGAAKEEVSPLSIENKGNYQIYFCSRYFLEALRAFDDANVYINLTGEVKPIIITSDRDVNLIQYLLPVKG